MKQLISFLLLLVFLAPSARADGDDLRIRQRNTSNTGYIERDLPADQVVDTWAKFLEEAGALPAANGTATNTLLTGSRYSIVAGGNASANDYATTPLVWGAQSTYTVTLNQASTTLLLDDDTMPTVGVAPLEIVIWQDGTGNRTFAIDDETGGTDFTFTAFQINPRANTETRLYLTKTGSGTTILVQGPEPVTRTFVCVTPNDFVDATRDKFGCFRNLSGRDLYLTSWYASATGLDNSVIDSIFTTTSTGGTGVTLVSTITIATDGTDMYYGSGTVGSPTLWANGALMYANYGDSTNPATIEWTGIFWP